MTELTKSMRYRVNVTRGMKGGVSFEATVDGTDYTLLEVLAESDKLVHELQLRYPVEEGK